MRGTAAGYAPLASKASGALQRPWQHVVWSGILREHELERQLQVRVTRPKVRTSVMERDQRYPLKKAGWGGFTGKLF